jgi:membrane fusion protein (multidrug efflux system)
VEENDAVTAGSEILRLDDGDTLEALELAKHQLALVIRDVNVLHARVQRLRAEVRLRSVTHELAQDEYQRRKRLVDDNMVSIEELDSARTREEETLGMLETAELALQEALLEAGTRDLPANPLVMAAAASLRTAYRDWRKTVILAPASGEIARRGVQVGQRVDIASPLITIAERQSAWVEANFKENQLANIRPGQAVTMVSDLYGDALTLSGRVESIGTGTGAVFSLLPPQNATGNWIKIVQRVPVRISLDEPADAEHPLPFGASLSVRVDTSERTGPRRPPVPRATTVAETAVFSQQDLGASELIASIIAANRGP